MPLRFQKEGNPYYPLPPDYPTLSAAGQRKARLNAVMLQETPEDLVHAWHFFREYYLSPPSTGWYKRYLPSPAMHFQIARDIGTFSMNAWAAPRSFAKTTVVRENALMLCLTRKYFNTALIQATEKKFKKSLAMMRRQLMYNPFINDDFGDLWGSLRGKRGDRTWNTDCIELPNGSIIEGLSVNGALRGERPDLILVDDPEYDEEESDDTTKRSQLLQDFDTLLSKTILGMLDDGSCIFWIGTLISRQSFIYHICSGSDPKFQHWNRRILSAVMPDGSLLWEAKWDLQALRDKKSRLGETAFNSEMMNRPGSPSDRMLKIHPDLCTYRVEGQPAHLAPDPLFSDSVLVYREGVKDGESIRQLENRVPFGKAVQEMYRLITVDYASTMKSSSDYSCVLTTGLDRQGTLWVLDIFMEKVREDELIRMIWEMANRWKVRTVGIEAVSVQKHLADRIQMDFSKRLEGMGTWRPKVFPIKYPPRLSKAERIAGLEWRFNQFRVRLPAHRVHEKAVYSLFSQIENFTPDLSMLRFDDAVDTLAMQQYVLKRAGNAVRNQGPNLRSPLELLRSGQTISEETGLSLFSGLDSSEIPMDVIRSLRQKHYEGARVPEDEEEVTPWSLKATPGPFSILLP